MLAAEQILRVKRHSQAARNLADQIKKAFIDMRQLFKRYEQNIEVVDPQLKNNPELVECLVNFETSWEKGKDYFLNIKRRQQLIHFSNLIEKTAQKYEVFKEQLECRDAELFMSIPALCILVLLTDNDKGICKHFFSEMFDEGEINGYNLKHLRRAYNLGKLAASSHMDYYNLVEMEVLGIGVDH